LDFENGLLITTFGPTKYAFSPANAKWKFFFGHVVFSDDDVIMSSLKNELWLLLV
jgi:hypothetical protein